MKPFDIEKAKAGARVVTKGGSPARILCYDLRSDRPIVAALSNSIGGEFVLEYSQGGIPSGYMDDNTNLMLADDD